jgi:hypothetical protein
VRTEYSQLVRAPRERVFEAFTDYETIPTWDRVLFKRVTVAERGPNTATLDADVRFLGMTMRRTERHVLTPPEGRGGRQCPGCHQRDLMDIAHCA